MAADYFYNIYSGRAGKRNPGCYRKCPRPVGPMRLKEKTTRRSV
jgi:hypothetical protein